MQGKGYSSRDVFVMEKEHLNDPESICAAPAALDVRMSMAPMPSLEAGHNSQSSPELIVSLLDPTDGFGRCYNVLSDSECQIIRAEASPPSSSPGKSTIRT